MDIRIINTKNRIQNGLIAALKDKPLYQLKDKEIISKAEISSASYYKYYSDKGQVLRDLEQSLIAEYQVAIDHDVKEWKAVSHSLSKKDFISFIDYHLAGIINFFRQRADYLSVLISPHGDPSFTDRLFVMTEDVSKKIIIYYFRAFNRHPFMHKENLSLSINAQMYTLSFLYPLFSWIKRSPEMSVGDAKDLMKTMILRSPCDVSVHGFITL